MKDAKGNDLDPKEARALLEGPVWLPQRGKPDPHLGVKTTLLQVRIRRGAWVVAFGSLELAVSAEMGQDDVLATTLWDALRHVPYGCGLMVNPGQPVQLWIKDEEIDRLLGCPRESALPLSPVGLSIWAHQSVTVIRSPKNGIIVAHDRGNCILAWRDPQTAGRHMSDDMTLQTLPLGALASGQGVQGYQLALDPGPTQHLLDSRLLTAVGQAFGMFPGGAEVVLAAADQVLDDPLVGELKQLCAKLLTPGIVQGAWLLAYQARGGAIRLLLAARIADGGPLPARCTAAFDQWLAQHQLPAQLWHMQWADLPEAVQLRLDGDLAASAVHA